MKPQNELVLIVAHYLSRLDRKGYSALGYKNFNEVAKQIGITLDAKHHVRLVGRSSSKV